jgi:peptidoglycan/LPS O-acetylase OafA/YrhL
VESWLYQLPLPTLAECDDFFSRNSRFLAQCNFFPFSVGIARVYMFFLIAGFCIHLAWCKMKLKTFEGNPKIDFWSFWKRRLWRLYPTYLIALVVYFVADFLLGKIVFDRIFIWDTISHALMIHNFDARTVYGFNGQFWTLAIEEQLYLAYFLLIWLRIKYGWKVALSFCFIIRIAWFILAPIISMWVGFKIPTAESSFGTWILRAGGALSVEYALGIIRLPKWTASFKVAFLTIGICAVWYVFGLLQLVNNSGLVSKIWWLTAQPLWGLGFFFLINSFVSLENENLKNWQLKLLKIGAWFGAFSYSIYLMCEVVRIFPNSHWTLRAILTIIIAYIFHLLFERPFMSKNRREQISKDQKINAELQTA